MSGFITNLDVRLLEDTAKGSWLLLAPLSFQSDKFKKVFTSETGRITDFCSVPRIPILYEKLGNLFRKSGAIHDKIYETGEIPRSDADELLREMVLTQGATIEEADEIYFGVRAGGASHYNNKGLLGAANG